MRPTTRPMTTLRALVVMTLPMLALSACGGGDGTDHDYPACAANTLHLQGEIDGMSVDITVPGAGGGLTQTDGGEFQSQSSTTPDPAVTDLRLAWTSGITTGDTEDAKGTLRMVTGPFAGQTFCVGDGTRVHIPADDTLAMIQFKLTGLRTGSSCTEKRTGTLLGCMR